jgi:hypothetical protein
MNLPMFEASDEAGHFAYADFLARERRLPNLKIENPSHEAFQPPLYYTLVSMVIAPFDYSMRDLEHISKLNPDWFDRELNPDYASIKNIHLHTPNEQFPYSPVVWAVRFARFFSTILGVFTLVFAFRILVFIFKHLQNSSVTKNSVAPQPYLLGLVLIAFNPKFIHISSVVSNDIAVILTATMTCWWMLKMQIERNYGHKPFFVLGVLIGVAGLCKLQAFGLALAAGWLWFRAWLNRRASIADGVLVVVGMLAMCGWWLGFNTARYSDPLAWGQVQWANLALKRDTPLTLIEIVQTTPRLLRSFWGVLGIEKGYPIWLDAAFGVVLIGAVVGCVLLVTERLASKRRDWAESPVLLLIIWQLTLLGLFLNWMREYVGTENSRLLLPSLVLPALLIVLGWRRLMFATRFVRMQKWAGWVGIAGMTAMAVYAPFGTFRTAFAEPAALSQAELANLPNGNVAVFGGQIGLRHAQINQFAVNAGDRANIIIFWGATQPITHSYRVLIEAVGLNGELVGRKLFVPFGGRYPTYRWSQSELFRDDYTLPIDDNAPPGPAVVSVALLSNDALTANAPQLLTIAPSVTKFVVGKVKINADQPSLPPPSVPLPMTFLSRDGSRVIHMTGADLKPINTGEGETVEVKLYFEGNDNQSRLERRLRTWLTRIFNITPNRVVNKDYTLFIHALGIDGKPISQIDSPLRNGLFPTSYWTADDRLIETRQLKISADVVKIQAGWYDPITGERLISQDTKGELWSEGAVVLWEK